MISSANAASMMLAKASTLRAQMNDGGLVLQESRVMVAASEKPELERGALGKMAFGPDHARQHDNSAVIEQFLAKALNMAKGLARLRGSSVESVFANLPGGEMLQPYDGWNFFAGVTVSPGGGFILSSRLDGTDRDDELIINTGDSSQAKVTQMSQMPMQIDAGAGNDTLTLASQRVSSVNAGSGDDRLAIDGMLVSNIRGGAGSDAIAIAGSKVRNVEGGGGTDAISISARRISNTHGGAGDDALTLHAQRVRTVHGGDGHDVITVQANEARDINGGAGNDMINVTAEHSTSVQGGAGDDRITVAADLVLLRFEGGDGQDLVQVNRAQDLTIDLGAADLNTVEISHQDDRLSITLQDGSQMIVAGLAATPTIRIATDDQSVMTLRSPAQLEMRI